MSIGLREWSFTMEFKMGAKRSEGQGGAQARGGGAIGSFAAGSDLAVVVFLSVHSVNSSGRELEQVGVSSGDWVLPNNSWGHRSLTCCEPQFTPSLK